MSRPEPGRCLTCADEAVEAVVIAVDGADAIVEVAGGRERVAIDLIPALRPGDLLLCHAGIALERLPSPPDDLVAQSRKTARGLSPETRPAS
jgi:hydrogenase maturation factor